MPHVLPSTFTGKAIRATTETAFMNVEPHRARSTWPKKLPLALRIFDSAEPNY